MSDRNAIVDVLRQIRRRRALRRSIRQTAWALGTVVLFGSVLKASGQRLETLHLVGAALGLAAFWWWSFSREGTLARVAGEVDRGLELHDELKTAHGFIRENRSSPWVDLQIHYAARTARGLEPERVVPLVLPKTLLVTDGLLLVLAVFWSLAEPVPPRDDGSRAALSELNERARRIERRVESLALRETEPLEGLEDTLERVEQGEISVDEGLQEIQEVENQYTEATLEAGALQEDLERVAEELGVEEALEDVAGALHDGRLEEAAELLRELAESAEEAGIDLDDLKERLEFAETRSVRLEEWLRELRRAVEALQAGQTEEARRLLEAADERLKGINLKLQARRQMGEAALELRRLRSAMARKTAGLVQKLQPRPEEMAELAEALARVELQDPRKPLGGNPNGAPLGLLSPPEAAEVGEPTPLDVQLERQILGEKQEDPKDEDIRERPSRRQSSTLDQKAPRARSRYAEADVMHQDVIPWRYRSLVKEYFRVLRR